MPVESATYISQLDPSYPAGSEFKSQGDNHLRLIKFCLDNTFPNFTAIAMNASTVELNYSVGLTGIIQTQLDNKVGANSPALTGTPTAPTASIGTNTTQIATTAYVISALATGTTPAGPGDAGKFWYYSGVSYSWQAIPAPTVLRSARTANVQLVAADRSSWIDVTSGTFTQTADTAANLGNGWWAELGNSGTGIVTFGTLAIYQGQRYRLQSDGTTIRTSPLADQGLMIVRDEKTAGTNGGTGTSGSWQARTLNTTVINTISNATLAGNLVMLSQPGTYELTAYTMAGRGYNNKARLYNVTGSVVIAVGTTATNLNAASSPSAAMSFVRGSITITGATSIRLEHYLSVAGNADDFGAAYSITSTAEVYAEVSVRKIG